MNNDGTLPEELNDLIGESGLPLMEGVRGIGFLREPSLLALDVMLTHRRSAVLGGDVYEVVRGKLVVSHDNWHCDRLPGEEWSKYVERSINHSRAYISNYRCDAAEGCVFALVVQTRS
jgi:hypothetical protein